MSNSEQLLKFWEKNLEAAFTRSMTRGPPILVGGRDEQPLPFQIQVRNDLLTDSIEVTGRYTLGARQIVSSMSMMDFGPQVTESAGRAVRRAIARRLIEDAANILAEGEKAGTLMGMDVIVSQNMPENIGMMVHPRLWGFLLSQITMSNQFIDERNV